MLLHEDAKDKNLVWLGTDKGLYSYNKITGQSLPAVDGNETKYTVTEINTSEAEKIWFSTLEKGMGVFNVKAKSLQFYPWTKTSGRYNIQFPLTHSVINLRNNFLLQLVIPFLRFSVQKTGPIYFLQILS